MATEFLQKVQSVMQANSLMGRFMHDPILTENVASVDVFDDQYIVVTEIQVPQEVGYVSHYLMVDGGFDGHGLDVCYKIIHAHEEEHQQIILDHIISVAEERAA